jgi:hypothetical protein
MALDAKAPQPIANFRRVNNIEFRASSVQHIILLLDTIDEFKALKMSALANDASAFGVTSGHENETAEL